MFDATFAVIENAEQRNKLSEFYSVHKNRLFAIAISKLHDKNSAEDAVQEVFADIADKPERFFDILPNDRLAYVDVMLRNIAVDMFKRENKVKTEELDEEIEDVHISLEKTLLEKIERSEIERFIKHMPTMRQNVLVLRCYFDLSIKEISQRLNIAPATVSKHLTLARTDVRNFIDERNKNHE